MGLSLNDRVIRARSGTVVERERVDVVRVVPRDGITRQHAILRFACDILWLRRVEYAVKSFTHDKEVGEHGLLIDVGRPLSSLDQAIDRGQSVAADRKMTPAGENACETWMLIHDHAVIEMPEELKPQLYDRYRSGADLVYMPVGEDWWRADPAALDLWLSQPPFERSEDLIERLSRPRPVFSGPVWSSRWTPARCTAERERLSALAVPPAV